MRRRIVVQWVLACCAGEVFGFGIAAWTLGLLLAQGAPDPFGQRLSVLIVVLSVGALEGTLLGALQSTVLKKLVPALSANAWVGVTALMAVLGWLGAMLAPLFGSASTDAAARLHSDLVVLGLAMLFGGAAGALIGVAQGLVLRPHVARWPAWIWTNALGWALGLPFTFLAARSVPESAGDAALAGAWAGLGMGACVGVLTSLALLVFARAREVPLAPPRRDQGAWTLAEALRVNAAGGRLDASLEAPDSMSPPNASGQAISLDGPFEERPPFHQK